ncbi:hypothetical protein JCM10599A_65430 [Paraburkholderia kururiensis]
MARRFALCGISRANVAVSNSAAAPWPYAHSLPSEAAISETSTSREGRRTGIASALSAAATPDAAQVPLPLQADADAKWTLPATEIVAIFAHEAHKLNGRNPKNH